VNLKLLLQCTCLKTKYLLKRDGLHIFLIQMLDKGSFFVISHRASYTGLPMKNTMACLAGKLRYLNCNCFTG